MNTILKMLLAGLLAVIGVACGEEPDDQDTDSDGQDSETEEDTNVDTTVVSDKNALVGKTYTIAFDPNYWSVPRDVGSDIGEYVPAFMFTFTTVDAAAMTFEALLGTANDDGTQDTCNKTVTVTGTFEDAASTVFKTTAIDFEAILTGPPDSSTNIPPNAIAPIHDFALQGTFTNQGAGFKFGVIDAIMDLRDISCLFMLVTDPANRNPEYICAQMNDQLAYDCEVCPFDQTPSSCVTMKAELFKTTETTATMVEVADFGTTCVDTSACE